VARVDAMSEGVTADDAVVVLTDQGAYGGQPLQQRT
jgi:hypothetical protein